MKDREIKYLTKIVRRYKGHNKAYHDLWGDLLTKSYHNVLLFSKQVGFHPLTFTPIKGGIGGIFEVKHKSDGSVYAEYIRHHLDNYRKKSILLQDLLLTDNKLHAKYEKLIRDYGVDYSYKLNVAFGELVSYKGRVDENFIIKVFNKHGVIDVYNQYYKTNKKFNIFLAKFNDRCDDLQQLGVDGFMDSVQGDYPILYERFYREVKKDNSKFMMLLVSGGSVGTLSTPIDESTYYIRNRRFSDLFAIDYYFSHMPDTTNYFNFKPHMFKYWFGD